MAMAKDGYFSSAKKNNGSGRFIRAWSRLNFQESAKNEM